MTLFDRMRAIHRSLHRGARHRTHLADIDIRVAVTGSRCTRAVTKWLHSLLTDRGFDVCTWLGGPEPCMFSGAFRYQVDPGVRGLATSIQRAGPCDVLLVENPAEDEYSLRIRNNRLISPHHVLVTNIRPDHGVFGDWKATARAFARSTPSGTRLYCMPPNGKVRRVLRTELARRDAQLIAVSRGDGLGRVPDQECVQVMDEFLTEVDGVGLGDDSAWYRADLRPRWTTISGIRVGTATMVFDTATLEQYRQSVFESTEIQAVVELTAGHDARSAAYVRYLNELGAVGIVRKARIIGSGVDPAVNHLTVPVIVHDQPDPTSVLQAAIADRMPVMAWSTAPSPFLAAFADVVRDTAETDFQRPIRERVRHEDIAIVGSMTNIRRAFREAVADASAIIVIDFTEAWRQWITQWRAAGNGPSLVVITGPASGGRESTGGVGLTVEVIDHPENLDRVLLAIDESIEAAEVPPVVIFASVSDFVGAIDQSSGLEFVEILGERIRQSGGVGYLHVERAMLDESFSAVLDRRFAEFERHDLFPV